MLAHWRIAAAALALAIAFTSGWTVRAWKASADMAKIERKLEAEAAKQRARADEAAARYEETRSALARQSTATQTTIREYYNANPADPDCAVPEPVVDGLRAAVETANRAASGKPAPALP